MNKEKLADDLLEELETYIGELVEESNTDLCEEYLIDSMLSLQEAIYENIEEGRLAQSYRLITDKSIKLYSTINLNTILGGKEIKVKVMRIGYVKINKDNNLIVKFLGKKVK